LWTLGRVPIAVDLFRAGEEVNTRGSWARAADSWLTALSSAAAWAETKRPLAVLASHAYLLGARTAYSVDLVADLLATLRHPGARAPRPEAQ
jgi:hypothetical protein